MARMRDRCERPGADRRRRRVRLPRRADARRHRPRCSASASSGCTGCCRSRAACGGATRATTRASCWGSRASTAPVAAREAESRSRPSPSGSRSPVRRRRMSSTTIPRRRRADRATRGSSLAPRTARSSSATRCQRQLDASGRRSGATPAPARPRSRTAGRFTCSCAARTARPTSGSSSPTAAGRTGCSLGGYATSGVGVNVRRGADNYLDLAVKGGNNEIFHRAYVPGSGWTPFASHRRWISPARRRSTRRPRTSSTSSRAATDFAALPAQWSRHGVDGVGRLRRRHAERADHDLAPRERRRRLRPRDRQRAAPALLDARRLVGTGSRSTPRRSTPGPRSPRDDPNRQWLFARRGTAAGLQGMDGCGRLDVVERLRAGGAAAARTARRHRPRRHPTAR